MRLICFTVFLTAAVLLMVCPAMGQFTVNVLVDSQDASPGDGVCADAGGNCSLRAAVMEANATAGPNDIFLPAGDYLFTLEGDFEDACATGDLDITDDLQIIGEDTRTTVIRADSLDRIFHVFAGVSLDVSFVELREGYVSAQDGGAVLNEGNLVLSELSIWSSMAQGSEGTGAGGGFGGGICNRGTLSATSVTVANCTALGGRGGNGVAPGGGSGAGAGPGLGGGLYNDLDAVITCLNVTVSGNLALGGTGGSGTFHAGSGTVASPGGAGGGFGGVAGGAGGAGGNGLWAGGGGGGGSILGAGGAGGFGGGGGGGGASSWGGTAGPAGAAGQYGGAGGQGCCSAGSGGGGGAGLGGGLFDRGGNATLTNCTFAFNQALGGAGGPGWFSGPGGAGSGLGGGVFNLSGSVELNNCLLAENTTSTSGPSLAGEFGSAGGHNLIQSTDAEVVLLEEVTNNQLDVDPTIYALANNGGNTDTHLLSGCDPVSPAVDAGNDAFAPGADQIGQARIGVSDIGALEIPAVVALLLPADTTLCVGQTLLLDMTTDGATYVWSDGSDGPVLEVEEQGVYSVTVSVDGCDFSDDIAVEYNPLTAVSLGPDQSLCPGQDITLECDVVGETYLWQDGATSSTYTTSEAGEYSVTVTVGNCSASDAIAIEQVSSPELGMASLVQFCEGDSATIGTGFPADAFSWNTGESTAEISVYETGIYTLEVTVSDCVFTEGVEVLVTSFPEVDLGPDITLCAGQTALLEAPEASGTFVWSDGTTGATLETGIAGVYTLEVTSNGCTAEDEVEVTVVAIPAFELGPDVQVCYNEYFVLEIAPSDPGVTVLWNTGETAFQIEPTVDGIYEATAYAGPCQYTDQVVVEIIPPLLIDLGEDIRVCEGTPVALSPEINGFSYPLEYSWSNGLLASEIAVEESDVYQVDVTSTCESVSDDVWVEFEACDCRVYVPNTFTPDNDGINDVFQAVATCDMIHYTFSVFNRNGELVFSTQDTEAVWNGSHRAGTHYVPDGVYAWRMEYTYLDLSGTISKQDTGHVLVIR